MKPMTSHILFDGALFLVTMACFASSSAQIASAPSVPATESSSQLSDEVKNQIDKRLDSLMADFDLETCDALIAKYAQLPVIPYLIEIAQDEERGWWPRQKAILWLVRSGDSRCVPVLIDLIHKHLSTENGELTTTDEEILVACIAALGHVAQDRALDELLDMLKLEYWTGKTIAFPKEGKTSDEMVGEFRDSALQGIARAGTDRAVAILETGEGIPKDVRPSETRMQVLLKEAREARQERQRRLENAETRVKSGLNASSPTK